MFFLEVITSLTIATRIVPSSTVRYFFKIRIESSNNRSNIDKHKGHCKSRDRINVMMDPFGQLPSYSTLSVQNDHHHHHHIGLPRGVLPGQFGPGIGTHSAINRPPGAGDYNMQHSIEGILGSSAAGNAVNAAGSTPSTPVTNGRQRSLSATESPGKSKLPLFTFPIYLYIFN